MFAARFRSPPLDPARVPPGIHPEDWALFVRREQRFRRLVRGALLAVLLAPLTWIGWRLAHPAPQAPEQLAHAAQLFEQGNARAALTAVRSSLREAPDVAAARRLAGLIHLHMGAYDDAVREFGKARQLGLDSPELESEFGTALLRAGEPDRLLALLETSTLRSTRAAEWHALRGAARRARGETTLARRDFDEALVLDPRNGRALRGHARLAADTGHAEEALSFSNKALAVDRRDVDSWLLRGELMFARGDAALAEDAWRTAAELNPFRAEAHAGLVRALLAQNELDGAQLALKALVGVAPRTPDTLFLRGSVAVRLGRADDAVDAWQQVLKRDPAHADTQLALGRLLSERGQRQQAFEWLGRYVDAHPEDVVAATEFARLALAVDAPTRALEALTALGPLALDDPTRCLLLGEAALDSPSAAVGPLVSRLTDGPAMTR